MNKYHFISMLLFISGITFFVYGVLTGEVNTGFILIFPFFVGSGVYALFGVVFIFVSILLFMFGFVDVESDLKELQDFGGGRDDDHILAKKRFFEGGGVVLIGPIPIVFGSNWKIAAVLIVLTIILVLMSFVFTAIFF